MSRDSPSFYANFDPKFTGTLQVAYPLVVSVIAYDAQGTPSAAKEMKITMETICPG